MQIISTFFNNEQYYLANFLHWYRTLWKADCFIFFIGKTVCEPSNYSHSGVQFYQSEKNGVITYEYPSTTNTPDQWHKLKMIFNQIVQQKHSNPNSLWVDCDEMIYCKNLQQTIDEKQFATHFFEYVPNQNFALNSNSLWSVHPWYYRLQALKQLPTHDDCKRFFIGTATMFNSGHMGNSNKYCKSDAIYTEYDNICYHVGVYSKEHFLTSKHWLQTHPTTPNIKNEDRQTNMLNEIFDNHYAQCLFPIFTLNLAKEYNLNV